MLSVPLIPVNAEAVEGLPTHGQRTKMAGAVAITACMALAMCALATSKAFPDKPLVLAESEDSGGWGLVLKVLLALANCSCGIYVCFTCLAGQSTKMAGAVAITACMALDMCALATSKAFPDKPLVLAESEDSGGWGLVLKVLLALAICSCGICVCFTYLAVTVVQQLMDPKMWRGLFDKECPAEKKAKYTSDEFKKKCNDLFKKADTKEPFGQLTRDEIKVILGEFFGSELSQIPTMTKEGLEEWKKEMTKPNAQPLIEDMLKFMITSFDDNKDEKINQEEFMELMKLLAWMMDGVKAAKWEEEAARNKA